VILFGPYFFLLFLRVDATQKKNSRQGFRTCAVVRDAIPPYTEWESEAITTQNRHHYFGVCVCLCLSVGFYFTLIFFLSSNTAGAFLVFFFSPSIVPFFFSSFHLKIKFLKLLLRFWSCWVFFF
jgi:hypothetical protein